MVIKKEYLEDFISVTQHAAIATYLILEKIIKKQLTISNRLNEAKIKRN